jgi:serine protease Do
MKERTLRIVGFSALLLASGIIGGIVISQLFGVGEATIFQSQQFSAYITALDERIEQLPPADRNFVLVAQRVTPSIVTIASQKMVSNSEHPDVEGMPEQFRRFFEENGGGAQRVAGLGSGVIIDADGLILTNHHVIEGADKIKVTFSDKRTLEAEVVGSDSDSDIAVLRVKATNLPALKFGDSEIMQVGEQVLAVGNPFSESLAHTVTAGIISGKGRQAGAVNTFQDFIQTDAAINPGNSGGALVNMKGELIGINSMIVSRTGTYNGIGFAIPSNLIKVVMDSLIKHGKVRRGYLGVYHRDLDKGLAQSFGLDRPMGALVNSVVEDSPADKAGLRSEDIVLEVNGAELDNAQDLLNRIGLTPPGASVELTILRKGNRETLTVVLEERPAETAIAPRQEEEEPDKSVTKLGLRLDDITGRFRQQLGDEIDGALVTGVQPGRAAEEAGIRAGMVISKVGDEQISSVEEFFESIKSYKPGDYVRLNLQFINGRQIGSTFVAFKIPNE